MKEELEEKLAEALELFEAKKFEEALAIIDEGQEAILKMLEQDPRAKDWKALMLEYQKLGARTRLGIHMAETGQNTDKI